MTDSTRGLARATHIGLWTGAILTGVLDLVNLVLAVMPPTPTAAFLEPFFPFPIRAGGRLFAAIAGFAFLTLAANLLRLKRVAWLLVC